MTNLTVSFLENIISEMLNNNERFRYINSHLPSDYYTINDLKDEIEKKLDVSVYSHSDTTLMLHKDEKTIRLHRCGTRNNFDAIGINSRFTINY